MPHQEKLSEKNTRIDQIKAVLSYEYGLTNLSHEEILFIFKDHRTIIRSFINNGRKFILDDLSLKDRATCISKILDYYKIDDSFFNKHIKNETNNFITT